VAKAGRPSSYKEAYCNEVIECLAKGHSITAFAGEIGVARSTIFDWMKALEVFKEACERGAAKAVLFWEKELLNCAKTGKGNVTAIIFGLKNRAHEDWRDVQKLEHTGKDGGAIQVDSLTTQERARALAAFVTKTKVEKPDATSGH
jgi:Helix-turn-helix domain of resolvase